MRSRLLLFSFIGLLGSCNGGPPPTVNPCTAFLPPAAKPSTGAASGLSPDDAANSGACTEVTTTIARARAADIAPSGYRALGTAVEFTVTQSEPIVYPSGIDFVIPVDLSKSPTGAPDARVVVVEKRAGGAVVVTPVSNVLVDGSNSRLRFHSDELGTYQAAIPTGAGSTVNRHYTYRALSGVSMGGMGSSLNFWMHPERYDAVAVMGADPGPDLTYTLGMLRDFAFSGFCTVADQSASGGKSKVGQMCLPTRRKPLLDQNEAGFDFEHFPLQTGEGTGLTLRRRLYMKGIRELVHAFGNASVATAAGASPYLPPGVPPSTLRAPNADVCAHPTTLANFFDGQYNPDGKLPVVSLCDSDDADGARGVFVQANPPTNPTQVALFVDVNSNGRRDSGEPVILQGAEPYRDYGMDGLPDEKEPGYNPLSNPDPNHDDYHWLHNPTGTENNWRYDAGEPYDDFGVDGVQGKGCPVGSAAGCYDYGEGNHQFDYNVNLQNWLNHDPRTLLEKASVETLNRLDVYYDAGIHDFFNAQVSTNSLMGTLHARGQHVRIFENFTSLVGAAPGDENRFNATNVDFSKNGHHLYVRYGNPYASPAEVEATGDGRHVGTVLQAVHRAEVMFFFLSHVWPGGDFDASGNLETPDAIADSFIAQNGRKTLYDVLLPPGYAAPENANKRYPVVYLFHGWGMDPKAMIMFGGLAQSAMANSSVAADRRVQKMIMVAVDGTCVPGGEIAGNGPLRADGDQCESGNFFTNHPDGSPTQFESSLLQLEDLIDTKYRTKAPEDRMVVQ